MTGSWETADLTHGSETLPSRPAEKRSAPLRVVLVAVVLALLAVSGASAWVSLSARGELDRVNAEMADATDELAAVRQQLEVAQEEQAASLRTLADLEAEVRGQPDTSQTARRAGRSVYTVLSGPSTGSGFAVRKRGGRTLLVTNFHVVGDEFARGVREVEVTRGNRSYAATVTDVARADDLAVLVVQEALPTISLREKRPKVGDPVLVLGSPGGLGGTVTSGIVSAFRKRDGLSFLQFSAPIGRGSSGGPVLDARGRAVGVTVGKNVSDDAEGLSFAIPTDRVCAVVDLC